MSIWFITKLVLYSYFIVLCPLYFMNQIKNKRQFKIDVAMLTVSLIVSFYGVLSLYKEFL